MKLYILLLHFVFLLLLIASPTSAIETELSEITASKPTAAVGSSIELKIHAKRISTVPVFSLLWKYNETAVWNHFFKDGVPYSSNRSGPQERIIPRINILSSTYPYSYDMYLTISDLQLEDNNIEVDLQSTIEEKKFILKVKECNPSHPGKGYNKVSIGREGECGKDCKLTFSCREGYFVQDPNLTTFTTFCQEDASVSPAINTSKLICIASVCEVTLPPDQAALTNRRVANVTYEVPESYNCTSGYIGDGLNITCMDDGTAVTEFSCIKLPPPPGMIAGIVVGCIAVVLLMAAVVHYRFKSTKKKSHHQLSENSTTANDPLNKDDNGSPAGASA